MKKYIKILWHIGYWALYLTLLLLFFMLLRITDATPRPWADGLTLWLKLMTGFAIIPGVLGFYTAYLYLYPRFLSHQKFLSSLAMGMICSIAAAVLGTIAIALLINPSFLFIDGPTNVAFVLLSVTLLALINTAIGAVVKGFITGYSDMNIKLQLGKRNRELELEYIKLQLDPHFLFNTINNIDILIAKDPEQASAYLNRLSEMMRFMLYETKNGRMPLARELDYLDKYISLQRLRTANPENINISISGNAALWQVEPMLFIPFIENAFKHYTRGEQGFITIVITITAAKLEFACTNSCHPNAPSMLSGGIGKELIGKRLTHAYPQTHQLTYIQTDHTHSVKLSIWP